MSPRPLPLALAPHRRREQPRAVPIPVTPSEMDTCQALERCGIPQDVLLRVVLPMARARPRIIEGAALIRYLLHKSNAGGTP